MSFSIKEHIEQLIDAYGLEQLISTIADIAAERSAHIQENWQDKPLAKRWERAANKLTAIAAGPTIGGL